VPLAGFGAGVADLLGVFVGVRAEGFVVAAAAVGGVAPWLVGAAGVVGGVGVVALETAAELGAALDAGFGEVPDASPTGGSLELSGEMNGGRATRVGADLKPSKTTMPVMVLTVVSTTRFMLATRVSQLERFSVDASPRDTATHKSAHRCISHRGRPAQIHVVIAHVGNRLRQSTGRKRVARSSRSAEEVEPLPSLARDGLEFVLKEGARRRTDAIQQRDVSGCTWEGLEQRPNRRDADSRRDEQDLPSSPPGGGETSVRALGEDLRTDAYAR